LTFKLLWKNDIGCVRLRIIRIIIEIVCELIEICKQGENWDKVGVSQV